MPPSLAPPLTAGPESCGRRALPRWVCQTGEMAERTMRAAVLEGVGKVTLQERPVPLPGPGEVLVQVAAVGTCGSDVHYYEHGRIGDFVVESPLVLGHEPSGVVVAGGPGADRHEPGQRVSIEPGVPDFTCEYCRAGRYNLCPRMRFFGTPPIDGAFCEYVVVHEQFAYPVPDSLSDDAAALVEPLSVGVWACRKARAGPGSRVLVAAPARSAWCACRRRRPSAPPMSRSPMSTRGGWRSPGNSARARSSTYAKRRWPMP